MYTNTFPCRRGDGRGHITLFGIRISNYGNSGLYHSFIRFILQIQRFVKPQRICTLRCPEIKAAKDLFMIAGRHRITPTHQRIFKRSTIPRLSLLSLSIFHQKAPHRVKREELKMIRALLIAILSTVIFVLAINVPYAHSFAERTSRAQIAHTPLKKKEYFHDLIARQTTCQGSCGDGTCWYVTLTLLIIVVPFPPTDPDFR
jgi:hypothetical protein